MLLDITDEAILSRSQMKKQDRCQMKQEQDPFYASNSDSVDNLAAEAEPE